MLNTTRYTMDTTRSDVGGPVSCPVPPSRTISIKGTALLILIGKGRIPCKGKKMSIEHTLSIIKPDAIAKNCIGEIYTCFERNHLKIVAVKMLELTKRQAEAFYSIHRPQPFFAELVLFMTTGPILVQALCGEDAVARHRALIGATDPKKAAANTIRARFAESIDANAVHGSDSVATAQYEIQFFFPLLEIIHGNH